LFTGVINVNKAVAARTFISPSQILLNDTQYLNSSQKITISNRNSFATTYQLSWTNAIGVATYDDVRCVLPLLQVKRN
jgi:hypothetical protein